LLWKSEKYLICRKLGSACSTTSYFCPDSDGDFLCMKGSQGEQAKPTVSRLRSNPELVLSWPMLMMRSAGMARPPTFRDRVGLALRRGSVSFR
jgi:hypothetical protein